MGTVAPFEEIFSGLQTILLSLDIGSSVVPLVHLSVDLAKRFDARLIGISAANVPSPAVTSGNVMQRERKAIGYSLGQLRKEFEEIADAAADIEWRSAVADPTHFLVESARMADLIVAGTPEGGAIHDTHRTVDPGRLALNAGRPVLFVASGARRIQADRVLVAWKDTREARRAVADAVPLLLLAKDVRVVTVDKAADDNSRASLSDVTSFLARHGIKAHAEIFLKKADGWTLPELAKMMDAGLIVSGAFGHSRFQERVFGGVTGCLLDEPGLNRFMSR